MDKQHALSMPEIKNNFQSYETITVIQNTANIFSAGHIWRSISDTTDIIKKQEKMKTFNIRVMPYLIN
jgi:hypothetical protein